MSPEQDKSHPVHDARRGEAGAPPPGPAGASPAPHPSDAASCGAHASAPTHDAAPSAAQETPRPLLEDVTADSTRDQEVARLLAEPEEVSLDMLAPALTALEPADAADALEEIDSDAAADVVVRLPEDDAAADIAAMETHWAVEILRQVFTDYGPATVARYLDRMEADDAVDILQALSEEERERILDEIEPRHAVQLKQLMRFDPETAGGMMKSEFVCVDQDATVAEAIESLRRQHDIEFNQVYCVDAKRHLVGTISPKALLTASAEDAVRGLIDEEIDYLRPDTDREDIAAAFERYDYTEMPVVDLSRRLLGVVTVDDVLDVIRAEHTEDAYKMVGAGVGEAVYSSVWRKFRGRFPWLVINVFTSMVAAAVVLQFDYLIAHLAILAVMMPVIANQAGNAGQQSLAVTLRGLVLGEVRGRRAWPLVRREVTVGVLNGLLVGTAVGAVVAAASLAGLQQVPWTLGVIIAVAMTASVGAGCLVGSAMPLLLDYWEFDPATGSTIFLTMVTDSVSFLTFLGLASLLQHALLDVSGGGF